VTSIDPRLFVLRVPSQQQIQVYDLKSFKQQQTLQFSGLSDHTSGSGLTSCVTNNCLYVSDTLTDTVYKVEFSANNKVSKWSVGWCPRGLSVNIACNLIVACGDSTIQEYDTSGSLVREISLESNDVELSPLHAIQLTNDQFVISCYNNNNDVVEVDTKGLRVVVSYTNQLKSTTQQEFNYPRHLSVDKNNEFILIADMKNNRIVILNRSLKSCACELNVMTSVDSGLQQPSCLYFDSSQNRLFVGEWSGQCRVLVFDNVIQQSLTVFTELSTMSF
jgi:DNA-binding beta-propeller fold protein YncE